MIVAAAADARPADKKDVDLGAMPEWDLSALYSSQDAPEVAADIAKARKDAAHIKSELSGQAHCVRDRWRQARGSHQSLRSAVGPDRQARVVCGLAVCRQHRGFGARQVLWRRAGKHYGDHHRSGVFRIGAQPDRTRGFGEGADASGVGALQAVVRRSDQGKALPARRETGAGVPREIDDVAGVVEPAVQRDDDGAALSMSMASRGRWRSSRR